MKPTPLMATPDGLITSICRIEGVPPVTMTGLKDLLMLIWPATFVSVWVTAAVLLTPWALVMFPIGTELVQEAAAPVATTSNPKSQLPPAASVAPRSWAFVAPGLTTIVGPPAQFVAAFAGFATARPAVNVLSLTDTFVSPPLDAFVTVIFTRETPPAATDVGVKVFTAVRPVVTVRLPVTAAGRAALCAFEKSAGLIVLTLRPRVVPVTTAVIVQVDSWFPTGRAATVPPVRIT